MRGAVTDLERPLAAPTMLPLISVRTLLPLARHTRSMLAASNEEVCHANSLPAGSSPAAAAAHTSPIASATKAVLSAAMRTQVSQQLAQVLRRVRDEEAGHAEHAE